MVSFFIFIAIIKLRRCLNVSPGYIRNQVGGPPECSPGPISSTLVITDPFDENPGDLEQVAFSERPYVSYLDVGISVELYLKEQQ